MSCRILVIPEDPTWNGYILKPLVERVALEAGRPKARVQVLANPRLQGYAEALRAIRGELVDKYSHWDVWVFCPDADQPAGKLSSLESEMAAQDVRLVCCSAVPELEAWLLAGFRESIPIDWKQVRSHASLKEEIFAPFLRKHGDDRAPGGGRGTLMQQTLRNYAAFTRLCPEISDLERRLRALFETRPD